MRNTNAASSSSRSSAAHGSQASGDLRLPVAE